jgi:hypothetical protein
MIKTCSFLKLKPVFYSLRQLSLRNRRLGIVFLVLCTPGSLFAGDSDGDSLLDVFEQQLLEKFAPQFFVNPRDCDVSPAEFQSGFPDPRLF